MYDQNRPEEPPRQPGEEQASRRRLGRSWGPAEEASEADGQPRPPGPGQPPEQYRFDPDRGRRHRYSEDPTGQVPSVPVERAETGPGAPATRRPNAGEQFEPFPPAPAQPEPQFAPPGAPPSTSANGGPVAGPPGAPGIPQTPAPPEPESTPQHSEPPSPVSPPRAPTAPTPARQADRAEPGFEPGPRTGPIPAPEGRRAATPGGGPTQNPSVPPVTEQAPPHTPQIPRQSTVEPTPPVIGPEDERPVSEQERLLELVRGVPGVRDAYHVTSPDGGTSLRLELEDGVDRDAVHASVSAVLSEQRAVEPGPLSADEPGDQAQAEMEQSAPAQAEVPSVGVVELRRVEINSSGLEAEVSVSLAVGESETSGAVTVPPVDWHVQHAASAAAVEALRPHLSAAEARVEVEHASIVPTGPVKTAVVVVLWMDGRTVRRLSGAAVVTAERTKAVVTATLSALAGEVAH